MRVRPGAARDQCGQPPASRVTDKDYGAIPDVRAVGGKEQPRFPTTGFCPCVGVGATKLGLKPNETITVEEAIKAIVTRSANDVAVAGAAGIHGRELRFAPR